VSAESYFISQFSKKSGFIGDDGAVAGQFVYSNDAFFENVHFKSSWMSLEQISNKAMLVNISDAVAMNAEPKYALLSVAIPGKYSAADMRRLADGFKNAADKYGIEIIGGDTIANVKLDISVTIISKAVRPLYRKGLKKGHLLAYTGRLGRSARDLRYLLRGGKVHSASKFVTFDLRQEFIRSVTPSLSCGMDISDGIFSDLDRLSSVNRIGFEYIGDVSRQLGCSGEEYEMLIGFDHRKRKKVQRLAEKSRTPLTIFAKAVRKGYRNRCKAHHF
jgi:thiamine-monophosphate kinase